MSFDLKSVYGFGTGALKDVEVESGKLHDDFNSYARVTAIDGNIISIDEENSFSGIFEKFAAGTDILIHASASLSATAKLGKFICAKITLANAGALTLDKDISGTFDSADLSEYKIQAVTFANFHCLKINSGGLVAPQPYSSVNFYGGILAIKCSHSLELRGGHIYLSDCGIPTYQKDNLRPQTPQEILGTLDADERAGEENFCKENIFPLNSGDGATFIFAKEIIPQKDSRIGNIRTHGKESCRGAEDSKYKPSNITNVGGSSIFIAYQKGGLYFENLAKYRQISNSNATKGQGLARCYIANNGIMQGDGNKLYWRDLISDAVRPSREKFIYDFGSGNYGDEENPNYPLNNIVTLFDVDVEKNSARFKLTTTNARAAFQVGAKCLIENAEDFIFADVVDLDGDKVFFSVPLPEGSFLAFTVPEFENFILSESFARNPFIIFVSDKCKISGEISGACAIVAKNFEVSSTAKLGSSLYLLAKNISGDIENVAPKYSTILSGKE